MDPFFMDEMPFRTLYSGAMLPAIGMGTGGLDRYAPLRVAKAVETAAEVGYRYFDLSSTYGNLPEVSEALRSCIYGMQREEFFLAAKLPDDQHGFDGAVCAVTEVLELLRTEYLDLFVIEWPFAKQEGGYSCYQHQLYMQTWRAMEDMHHSGLVRHLGTCNTTVPKLELLMRDIDVAPAVNEMELHPTFRQKELFDYCMTNEIQPVGFCSLGSPSRPPAQRWRDEVSDLGHPVVLDMARERGISPAQLLIRWGVTRGQVPLVFSTEEEHLREVYDAAMEDPLTPEEMVRLQEVDCGNRLVRGIDRLWKPGQDWQTLWDPRAVVER